MNYLLIFLGGGIGSVLRFIISSKINKFGMAGDFPLGIMSVNIIGGFLAGLLIGLSAKFNTDFIIPLFMVGVLGGFTTFSAFSVEAMQLIHAQKILYAGIYIGGTVCLSVFAAFAGFVLSK